MKIILVQPPDESTSYLQKAFNLLKEPHRGKAQLNLADALRAVGPATSTNTPEEAGSLIEQMAEVGIIDIDYGA